MKKKILQAILLTSILSLTSCSRNTIDDKTIVVGASTTPHAKILKEAQPYIESQGYELVIKEYSDYVLPNISLNDGELDANYFQHAPYLETFNKEKGTDLVSVMKVHYEPLSIYKGKSQTLENPNNTTVGIDNDSTNCARSLYLLEDLGLLKNLDHSKGFTLTETDVTKEQNPYNLKLIAFEAPSLPSRLSELDFAIINGNYAHSHNISSDLILGTENKNSEAFLKYANVIAVKKENKDAEAIKVLTDALKQPNIASYIETTFKEAVLYVGQ